MVVMVAAVLACPAQSNPLWYIMFGSDPIHTTHVMVSPIVHKFVGQQISSRVSLLHRDVPLLVR